MQPIPEELYKVLSERLKLGERARPVCRVEVDRLAFIPGRTEELTFLTADYREPITINSSWINVSTDGSGNPVYGGSSSTPDIPFVFPAQGYGLQHVTSHFGMRNGRMHRGIDIGCPIGTDILASWSGKVVKVDRTNRTTGRGYYITILHRDGVKTKYCHLSEIYVEVGQYVNQGEVIGKSGNTGHVISGGKTVDEKMRAQGRGAHLHFEIWVDVDPHSSSGQGGRAVNPLPYMNGSKKMYADSVNTGTGLIDQGYVTGYVGETLIDEQFTRRDWYEDDFYTVDSNFSTYSRMVRDAEGSRQMFTFTEGKVTTNLDINLGISLNGVLDLAFDADFNGGQGDELRVTINGILARRVTSFSGQGNVQELRGIHVPSGDPTHIRITIQYGGQGRKNFSLRRIRLQELSPLSPHNQKGLDQLDPTLRTTDPLVQGLKDFVFNDLYETAEIQVGQFVYMDTLTLDEVIRCEVDIQYEQECSEASVTIANAGGYFNPDYNPYYFPENYQHTPWSYPINGFRVGVLSENTPIRIYMGYGLHLIRVFTGLIDKVDIIGQDSQLTISCRDMYKKLGKVLTEEKVYPNLIHDSNDQVMWLKTAVVQDLISHAGMYNWRMNPDDLAYPDAVVEESYLIELNQYKGKVVRAVPDVEGEFILEDAESHPTPYGWMNPFVEEYGKTFPAFRMKVSEAVAETIKDTNYRAYCDRYGTFRLERIDLNKPIVATFSDGDNLISINKTIDFSRGRSHLVIFDGEGKYENFVDKEILLELKGEIRTATVDVPWAKTVEAKREVANKLFFDMKRLCRTLQVSIPGNPALDILDRVRVVDRNTSTRSVYTIKGIRHTFGVDTGYLNVLELTWSAEGDVV